MTETTVQEKVFELKKYFDEHEFEKSETLLLELLDQYPNYYTPLVLYTQLFSVIEHDNPLYNKMIEMTRRFSLWDNYPEHLIPLWYTKIRPQNILLKSIESTQEQKPNNESLPKFSESEITDEELNLPASIPVIEETVEEPQKIITAEDLLPDDGLLDMSEPNITEESTIDEFAELESLLPDLDEIKEDQQDEVHEFNTHELIDDLESLMSDDANDFASDSLQEPGESLTTPSEQEPVHPDDEILVASETMAGIFVQQKKYKQAIKVYRILMEEDAENFDYYFQKVQELEKLKG